MRGVGVVENDAVKEVEDGSGLCEIASGAFIILFVAALTEGKRCPDAFAYPGLGLLFAWIFPSVVWLIRA